MKLINDLTDLDPRWQGGAVTIGNFDGVHRGHAQLVSRLLAKANEVDGPAIVFTFDPHPVRLLRPDEVPPPLTWTDRKLELLSELGVDAMIAYPTDEALLQMTAREFFDQIVLNRLGAQALVEGPNFFFGHDRLGSIDVLREFSLTAGVELEVVEPVDFEEGLVSSSRVRRCIAAGQVAEARSMLSQPYRIRGMVTHGAGRGAKIGFPTANLEAIDTLLPADGVYAGRGYIAPLDDDGHPGPSQCLPAAVNIGPNPTFGESAHKVEIHLIGHDGPLYHQPMEVDFLAQLREIHPFDSVEALKAQLRSDVVQTAKIVAELA